MNARPDDRDEWIAMRAEALLDDYKADPKKVDEARESVSGEFDFYAELEAALDRLHETDNVQGTDVLVDLYRMARTYRSARDARLKDFAEDDAEAEWKQLGYDAAEARAWDLEDAA